MKMVGNQTWSWTLSGAVLITALVWLAYWPALHGGFILDDDKLLADNPLIKASDGIYRFWFTTEASDYWPVTNTTLWIDWRLWGTSPTGYHLENIALHVICCLLLWTALQRLSIPGALMAVLLFALHPVNVESVAWIPQRKNLLALLFSLLSTLWFLADDPLSSQPGAKLRPRLGGWYLLSLFAFAMAMLSKGSAVVLPLELLLLVAWRRRTITKLDLARIAPFFLVAAALAAVNLWFRTHGVEVIVRDLGFVDRALGAGAVIWFYLLKALLPVDLCFVYPQWEIRAGDPRWWLPLLAALAFTGLLWWKSRSPTARWARPVFFAWCFFCIALLPVMGFIDVGFMRFSLVADHYQHIALISVVAIVAAGWSCWFAMTRNSVRMPAIAAAVVLISTLFFLTRQQCRLYADPVVLYESTLIKNPGSALLHNNLAAMLLEQGEYPAAIAHLDAALRLQPNYAQTEFNLARAFAKSGDLQRSIQHYQETLRLDPDFAEAYNDFGVVLEQIGRFAEAKQQYEQAIHANPRLAEPHRNLAKALVRAGQSQSAIDQYRLALQMNPQYVAAHNGLGTVYLDSKQFAEAIEQFQEALKEQPNDAQSESNLGAALAQSGQLVKAIEHYRQALRLKPDYAEAQASLATVLAMMNRGAEAVICAEKAIAMARLQNNQPLAAQIQRWLTDYRAKQPASAPPAKDHASP